MESVLTVLPIGQGACNLVEVYDNSNKLVFLGMVDCGNKNEHFSNYSNVSDSFKYLREKMKARAQAIYGAGINDDQIYLDLFILTHQDGDHHNKFSELIENFIQNKVFGYDVKQFVLYKNNEYLNPPMSVCADYSKSEYKYEYELNKVLITHIYEYDKEKVEIKFPDKCVYVMEKTDTNKCKISKKGAFKYNKVTINEHNAIVQIDRKDNIYSFTDEDIALRDNYNHDGWKYYIALKAFVEYSIDMKNSTIIKESEKWFLALFQTKEDIKDFFIFGEPAQFVIGEFLKGGASYEKQANNFVKRISARTKTYVDRAKSDYSYEIKNGNTTVGTVKVLCNLEIGDLNKISIKDSHGAGPNYKNGSSLVTLWTIGDTKYLFPGDATVHTMMHLNTEYTNLPKNEQEICTECVKRESAIMTAPHHGSDHSSKGKKQPASSETKYQGDWGIYREFLDNYKPSAVTISAGRNYGFGHPGPEFIKATDCYFNNRGANEHIIYTCIHEDSKNKYYGLYQTSSPIYSTLQYDGGDRNVRFQRLQFNNSITPNYEIVNESKIACQCNRNLSNYITLDVKSCTGCSPKFIDESSRSSDWFKDYICETTIAEDENNEDEDDKTSLAICSMKRKPSRLDDDKNEMPNPVKKRREGEDEEVEMKGAAKERSNHKPMSEMPRPVKRRRTV